MADKKIFTGTISLPRASTADLRGRQSVRATFKLTEECIGAISVVATHLGIKQKSLFDHLVEDMQSLTTIARELKDAKIRGQNRIQKTFVISRKSLHSLDAVAQRHNAPRDALVEFSVQRLLPIIITEQKRHQARKAMRKEIAAHLAAGGQLIAAIKDELGPDDPVFNKMKALISNYHHTFDAIDDFIERGRLIEDFDTQYLRRMIANLKA